jgi:peroxiredoxin
VSVWAISPEPTSRLADYAEKHGLDIVLLSDPDLQVIRRYGIVNPQQPKVPHPTAIVVDRTGVIRDLRVDEDYTHRPAAKEILAAIDELPSEKVGS